MWAARPHIKLAVCVRAGRKGVWEVRELTMARRVPRLKGRGMPRYWGCPPVMACKHEMSVEWLWHKLTAVPAHSIRHDDTAPGLIMSMGEKFGKTVPAKWRITTPVP
jgi:hypothetical protein